MNRRYHISVLSHAHVQQCHNSSAEIDRRNDWVPIPCGDLLAPSAFNQLAQDGSPFIRFPKGQEYFGPSKKWRTRHSEDKDGMVTSEYVEVY